MDKDLEFLDYISEKLKKDNFNSERFTSGVSCLERLKIKQPDIVLTELELPNITGTNLIRDIRAISEDLPTIALTHKNTTNTIVKVFNLGINDYITKPFEYKELLARINARLNTSLRNEPDDKEEIIYRDIKLNPLTKRVYKDDKQLNLSEKEYRLLEFFLENQNQVFSRDKLLERVWENEKYIVTRSVDVYVGRIRQKLKAEQDEYIKTRRGFGYIMPSINN